MEAPLRNELNEFDQFKSELNSNILSTNVQFQLLFYKFKLLYLNKNFRINKIFEIEYSDKKNKNDTTEYFYEHFSRIHHMLVIIETIQNLKFGGFTEIPFNGKDGQKLYDNNSFIFSLDK